MLLHQRFMTLAFQGMWIKTGAGLGDFTAFLEIDKARSLKGGFLGVSGSKESAFQFWGCRFHTWAGN